MGLTVSLVIPTLGRWSQEIWGSKASQPDLFGEKDLVLRETRSVAPEDDT